MLNQRKISDFILRQLRVSGMEQKDLAEKTGIWASVISEFLCGRREVRFDRLVKLLYALGYEIKITKIENK